MSNVAVKLWEDILEIKNGKDYKKVKDDNGIYPIYGSGGIMGYANEFICPEDTVIIGRKGNIKNPIYVDNKFWNVDTAFGLVANRDYLYPKYLYYFCVNYNFERLNTTVTIPSLTKSNLLKVSMVLPPLDIQKHIADTLDKTQEIIDCYKKQLEELDNLIKATFYYMFGDPFDNSNNQERVPLSKLSDIIMGQSPKGDSYNNKGLGTPLLNGPTEFGIVHPVEKQWTTEPTKLSKKGDILFCVRGATAGRMNYADKQYCIGRGLATIRVNNIDTKEFIYSYLEMMYDYFQSTSNGSTFININKNQLDTLPIIYPSKEKQILFSKITKNIEEQKTTVKQSISESQNLFNSLMSKYFD